MPNRLNITPVILLMLLASCSTKLPLMSIPHTEPEPPRVIVKTVPQPIIGCNDILRDYGDFNKLNEAAKRENIKLIKQYINEQGGECDKLRLALLHSTPGKLRQTDTTIIEILDSLNLDSEALSENDRALVLLMRNEINQRGVLAKRVDRRADAYAEVQAENRQLLQRLAELQLQLNSLKNLEENIAPE